MKYMGVLFVFGMLAIFNGDVMAEDTFVVLAMGDSITAGTPGYQSPVEFPPQGRGDIQSQYAYWLFQKHPDWDIYNRGVGGETTDQILQRLPNDLRDFKPNLVILMAGVNDIYQGRPIDVILQNLITMFGVVRKSGARLLVCSVLPYNQATPSARERIHELNEKLREYTQKENILFCDAFKALEDPNRPDTLVDEVDGMHPGVEGYRLLAEAISASIL